VINTYGFVETQVALFNDISHDQKPKPAEHLLQEEDVVQ
jgi:hypothetical protein